MKSMNRYRPKPPIIGFTPWGSVVSFVTTFICCGSSSVPRSTARECASEMVMGFAAARRVVAVIF